MRIHMNGTTYRGDPVEIVRALQHDRFNMCEGGSVSDYIAFAQANLRRWLALDLAVTGATDAQRAASFVAQLLARGLAHETEDPKGKKGAPAGLSAADRRDLAAWRADGALLAGSLGTKGDKA